MLSVQLAYYREGRKDEVSLRLIGQPK